MPHPAMAKDNVAVITGGASGIGLAAAMRFAALGMKVEDVFTQDRVGLLFTITHTLFELGMKIHLARISTNADQALDVFYISDREGNKVTDLERMRSIKATGSTGSPSPRQATCWSGRDNTSLPPR